MITLFAGLIVWGVIDAFLTPDVTVGEPVIKNVTPSAGGNQYEVVVSVKNEEKECPHIFECSNRFQSLPDAALHEPQTQFLQSFSGDWQEGR